MSHHVAISGATSFVGAWLCHHFSNKGWKVSGLCRQKKEIYSGLKLKRLQLIQSPAQLHYEIKSDDGSMANWISQNPGDIWIHHHHHMDHFRELNYSHLESEKSDLRPLPEIHSALIKGNYLRIIYSGTYLEKIKSDLPYVKSKLAAWQKLVELTANSSLNLTKIMVPDTVGPYENEDRLIPSLIRARKNKTELELKNPDGIGVHVPITTLLTIYYDAAMSIVNPQKGQKAPQVIEVEGLRLKNSDWARFASENLLGTQFIDSGGDMWKDFWENYRRSKGP